MKYYKFLILLPLFFSSFALCQIPEAVGKIKPKTISIEEKDDGIDTLGPLRAGDLGIMIVASDTDTFIKEWLTSPSDQGISIKKTRWIKPGQTLYTAFLVTGLYYAVNHSYDYKVSFYVIGPDGKVVFGQHNYAGGKGKHPYKPTIYMADPALELVIQPEDPTGLYVIVARVEDQSNGKTAKNQYEIYVSEEKPEEPITIPAAKKE